MEDGVLPLQDLDPLHDLGLLLASQVSRPLGRLIVLGTTLPVLIILGREG